MAFNFWSRKTKKSTKKAAKPHPRATLHLEVAEPRVLLSADFAGGLIDGSHNDPGMDPLDPHERELLLQHLNSVQQPPFTQLLESQQTLDLSSLDELLAEAREGEDAFIDLLEASANDRIELVFVDTAVPNYQDFVDDLQNRDGGTQYQIFLLDGDSDGIDQINQILTGFSNVDAIHIVSHGEDGGVKLGNTWLTNDNLGDYTTLLSDWATAVSGEADLLFYGCDLGASENGNLLLDAITTLTGMDVAASDDLTGARSFGGDWDLEVQTGTIESQVAFSTVLQESWNHVLLPPSVSAAITDVTVTQGAADSVINLLPVFTDPDTNDADLVYSITANTNPGLFTSVTIDQGANTLTLDFADTFGTADITVTASDGVATTTDTFTIDVNPAATLWFSTAVAATTTGTGLTSFGADQVVTLGGPNLATGEATTDGTLSQVFQLAGLDVDGVHYVTSNLTIGTANSVAVQPGDVLLSLGVNATLASTSDTPEANLGVKREDVILMRPDTPGDYSKVNFFMVLESGSAGHSKVQGLTLAEEGTVVGDVYVPQGSFILTDFNNSVNLFVPGNLSTGAGSTESVLIDGGDLRQPGNVDSMIGKKIVGVELIENDTVLAGNTLKAGNLILTVNAADTVLGTDGTSNTTLSVALSDLFLADINTSGSGSADLTGTASLLLDGSAIGLTTAEGENLNAVALYAPGGSVANNNPVASGETYSVSDGARLTVAAGGLDANDSDPDGDAINTVVVSGPSKASAFTLNADGSFVYDHDNSGTGTDTFTYAVYDDKGGTATATVTITINDSDPKLHLTTNGNVTTAGPGNTTAWFDSSVVEFGGPTAALGDATIGNFYARFNLDSFTASDTKLTALHHVTTDLTIGTANTVDVKNGDLLLSIDGGATLNGTGVNTLAVTKDDVFIFRPDTAGDYSSGTFLRLLEDADKSGADITALTLVEELTVLGDTVLQPGSFLYAADSTDIKLLEPRNLNSASIGIETVIVDGTEQISGQDILPSNVTGLELVENDITIDGQTLKSGSLLISIRDSGTVFGSLAVEKQDIFKVELTNTSRDRGTTSGTPSLLLDGSDVNLTVGDGNEAVVGISLEAGTAPVTNANPVTAGESFLLNEGGTVTVANAAEGLLRNDSDSDGDSLAAVLQTKPKHTSSFTLNTDGTFTYVHDGSESTSDSFVYVASDGKGGITSATVNLTINPVADEAKLWFSTTGDTTTGGGSLSWQDNHIVRVADPNLSLDATTDGTFSTDFNIEQFTQGADADIDGLHHVTRTLTIGTSNAVTVQPGDILISLDNSVTLNNTETGSLTVDKEDIFIFRPETPGDNSKGAFFALLTNVNGDGSDVTAFTLVEQTTTIAPGLTVNAGEFLFVTADNDIKRLVPGDLASSPPGTVSTVIFGGVTLGDITGLELIEDTVSLGGATLSAGDLVLSQSSTGALATADKHDMFVADFSVAGATPVFSTSILFDASSIPGNSVDANEEIDAISLQPAQVNTPPVTSDNTVTGVGNAPYVFNLADFNFTDADNNILISIKVTGLETTGTLKLNGADITLNQVISRQAILDGKLTFTPIAGGAGLNYDSFNFSVNDGFADSTTTTTMTIDVTDTPPTTSGISDVVVTQGAVDTVINLRAVFTDQQDDDSDLVYSLTNTNTGLFTATTIDGTADTLTLDYNDNYYGNADITVKATDSNGGTVTTTFTVTVDHGPILLLTTQGPANTGGTATGLGAWFDHQLIQAGGNSLALGDNTVAEFASRFDLTDFTSADAADVDIDAVHVVTEDITIGTGAGAGGTVELKAGDLLLSTDNTVNFTGADASSITVTSDDVFIFRPTNPGNYTAGNFLMLFNDLTRDGSNDNIKAISLVEKDTLVGDITLNKGTFLYGQDQVKTPILFTPGDLAQTNHGTHQALYDPTEQINAGFDIMPRNIHGIELIEEEIIIGGQTLKQGSIVLSVSGDSAVFDNTSIQAHDMFVVEFNKTTLGSGVTDADARLLLDGEDVGLTLNNDEKIHGISIQAATATNLAPTLDLDADDSVATGNNFAVTFTEGGGAVAIVDTDVAVGDVNNTNIESATITLTNAQTGDVLIATGFPQNGIAASVVGNVVTLSGSSSLANYQTALQAITFNNTSNTPDTTDRIITVTVNDGDIDSNAATSTITVVASNDAPVLAGAGDTLAFTEGDAATAIDTTLTINDVDDVNTESATISITGGFVSSEDVLAFTNTANITGAYNAGTGVLTLTGTDTKANYEAALESITYQNSNTDQPNTGNRTVSFVVNDGDANAVAITSTVTVTGVNDIPVLAGAGDTLAFTEGDAATAIDTTLTMTDVDDNNIESATISITGGFVSSEDVLAFTNTANITGAYNAGTGVLTLTGTDTKANYEAALESITYQNSNTDQPNTGNRTVSFVVNDGDANAVAITSTVTVTGVNDIPVLAGAGDTLAFTEGDAATAIDTTLTMTDVDDNNIESATISITGGFVSSEDVLAFTNTANITGAYNAGTGVLTLTGTDTKANYEAALESITYQNSNTDQPNTGNRTVSFVVNDGDANAVAITSTVTVTGVNDIPVLAGAGDTLAFTEGDAATAIDTTLTMTDVDDNNIESATISITGGFVSSEDVLAFTNTANITGAYNAGTGVLTLTGTDTKANYEAALESITYQNSNTDQPNTGNRTVSFVVNDGDANAVAITSTVTVTGVNDIPVLAGAGDTLAFTEGDAATAIDTTLTMTDVDDNNIESATISITGGFVSSEDVLAFTNTANITGAYNAGTGVLTLTGTDTKANYEAALESITYQNSNTDQPNTGNRTVSFVVNDGDANAVAITSTVTVTGVNDIPVLAGAGDTLAFTEGDAATAIDTTLTMTDVDDVNIESATISITGGFVSSEDVLAFTNTANITGAYNAGTGVLTLTGTDTKANYEAALESITYQNSNTDQPNTGNRTVSFVVNDGDANAVAITSTVTVTGVNDIPVLAGAGDTLAFTEGDAATAIDTTLTMTDVDDNNIESATISITGGFVSSEDVLAFTNTANITGAYNAGTGVLTLTGTDTKANYEAALESITYQNSNTDQPNTGNRTVSFVVNDGDANAVAITSTVTVTGVNDIPVLAGAGDTLAFTEGDAATAIDTTLTMTDVDDNNIESATISITGGFVSSEDVLAFTNTANITGAYNAGTGVLTLTGTDTKANYEAALESITYQNSNTDQPNTGNRTVSFVVNDGDANAVAITSTVTVTGVNDIPVLAGAGDTLAFTEGDAATAIDTTLTMTDVDDVNIESATISITGGFVSSEDVLAFTNTANITGAYNAGTGVLTLTGTDTKANYEAALESITYQNSNTDQPNTGNRTVSFVVNDGDANAVAITSTVTVTGVNDIPVLAGAGDTLAFTEGDAATAIDTTLTMTDVDDNNIESATISITGGFVSSEDVLAFTNTANITGAYNAGTGVLTLTGTDTKANYEAALESITYQNSNTDQPNTGNRTISFVVNDGDASSATDTTTVTVNATNDVPTLDLDANNSAAAGNNFAVTFTEDFSGAVSLVDTDVAIGDVDDTNIESATIILTNNQTGDALATGALPAGISVDGTSTTTQIVLTGSASLADYQTALQAVTFNNSSDNPNTTDRNITVVVNDGDANASTATSTVSVVANNDAPTASNLTSTIVYSEGDVTVELTDIVVSDPDTNPAQTITAILTLNDPTAGQITTDAGGTYNTATGIWTITDTVANVNAALADASFTPTANLDVDSSITTQIRDQDNAGPANGTITLDVTAVNTAPGTAADSVTVLEDGTLRLTSANFAFTDVDTGAALASIKLTTLPTNGTLTFNDSTVTANQVISQSDLDAGNLIYAPDADKNGLGLDSLQFSVSDGGLDSNVATLTINVTAISDAPTATNNTVTTLEDANHVFSVADFNFSDVDADSLASIRISNLVNQGALTLNGTAVNLNQIISAADISAGNLVFTPDANDNGAAYASFNFVVNDGGLDALSASTLTIDVTAVNDAPIIKDESVSTPPNTTYIFTAANFDFTDADVGDGLASIQITKLESIGRLTLNGTDVVLNQVINKADIDAGLLQFEPLLNADGPNHDSFGFSISDGEASSPVSANITINLNTNQVPSAADSVITINEDVPYTFTDTDFNFTDPDPADSLVRIEISQLPDNGTLKLNGVAVSQAQDISVADLTAGNLTYTPASNANGTSAAFFQYRVFDGINEALIKTNLAFDITPINDLPQGEVGLLGTGVVGDLITADTTFVSDADGLGTFSFQWQSNGADITGETGSTFLPTATNIGQTITVSVTYTDADGTLETLTSNSILINELLNQAPIANVIDDIVVNEDSGESSIALDDAFTDPDNDSLVITVTSVSNSGLFDNISVGVDNNLLLTPAANAFGNAELIISATDPSGEVTTNTLTVSVTPENDSPVATIDLVTVDEDTVLTVPAQGVLINDIDIENDDLSVVEVTNGSISVSTGTNLEGDAGGTFNVTADGAFTFDPGPDFQQLAAGQSVDTQVIYTVTDPSGAASTAVLRVTVTGMNDAVEPQGDFLATGANEPRVVASEVGLLTNDADVDDPGTLRVVQVSNGTAVVAAGQTITGTAGGTFTVENDGSYRFDPGTDFTLLQAGLVQTTTITYIVEDASGDQREARLTIDVTGSNVPSLAASSSTSPITETTPVVTPEVQPQPEPTPQPEPEAQPEPDPEPETEADPEPEGEDTGEDSSSDSEPQPGIESLLDDDLVDVDIDTFSNPEISLSGIDVVISQLSSPTFQAVSLGLNSLSEFSEFSVTSLDARGALGLIGTTDSLILISSPDYKRTLDESRDSAKNLQQLTQDLRGGTLSVSAGVSIGYVIWLIRSGVIMSSVLSALPAWRLVDPLPILSSLTDTEEADGESIEDMVQTSNDFEAADSEPVEPVEPVDDASIDESSEPSPTSESKPQSGDLDAR